MGKQNRQEPDNHCNNTEIETPWDFDWEEDFSYENTIAAEDPTICGETSRLLSHFNQHFEEKNNQNRVLKAWFFGLTWLLIFGVSAGLLVSVVYLAKKEISGEVIAAIITSIVSLLTTILGLPLLLANYLFHKREDNNLTDLIYKVFCVENGIKIEPEAKDSKKDANKQYIL